MKSSDQHYIDLVSQKHLNVKDIPQKMAEEEKKCKNCERKFKENSFLKHLARAKKCSKAHTQDELAELRLEALYKAKLRNFEYKLKNKEILKKKDSEYYQKNKEVKKKQRKERYHTKEKVENELRKMEKAQRKEAEMLKDFKADKKKSAKERNALLKPRYSSVEVAEISRLKNHGLDQKSFGELQELENSVEKLYQSIEKDIEDLDKNIIDSNSKDFVEKSYNDLMIFEKWENLRGDLRTQTSTIAKKVGFKIGCFDCLTLQKYSALYYDHCSDRLTTCKECAKTKIKIK